MAVNLKGLVDSTPRVKPYTPLFEWVVNSIQSIQERWNSTSWVITIEIIRHHGAQNSLLDSKAKKAWSILWFTITDNGIWFNDSNTESFDTLFSDHKSSQWCIWYWRCTALKVFREVEIKSTYEDWNTSNIWRRSFKFNLIWKPSKNRNILVDEQNKLLKNEIPLLTTIHYLTIQDGYRRKLDKTIKTIAKRFVEHLLPYFADEELILPKIVLKDWSATEILNTHIDSNNDIEEYEIKDQLIEFWDNSEIKLKLKVYLFHWTQEKSSHIILTAHNREVEKFSLWTLIPEFSEWIIVKNDDKKDRKFHLKVYVSGEYLDNNVDFQRQNFTFWGADSLMKKVSQDEIVDEVCLILKKNFTKFYESKLKEKKNSVRKKVKAEMPRFNWLLDNINIDDFPLNESTKMLSLRLHEIQFDYEQKLRKKIESINFETETNSDEVNEVISSITDIQKDQLVHYVAMRKMILQSLEQLLAYNHEDQKFSREDQMHNLIFKMGRDSDELKIWDHNLRVLDERLVFNEYITSDKPIFWKWWKKPDIVVFWNKIICWESGNHWSPIIVFEFKRPWDKLEKKDHILQLTNYIKSLRNNDLKDEIKRRDLIIHSNTLIYGYLICDLNKDIKDYAEWHWFTMTPDMKWYTSYNSNEKVKAHIEILSWDKILSDSKKRHKAFFKKLWIE